jgi:hypothetical protein
MFDRIGDYLDLYKFGNGSIAFCLGDMRQKADALGNTELVDRIDQALALNREARKMNYDWKMQKHEQPASRSAAAQRDVQIDRTLSQIYDVIKAFASLELETAEKEAAQELKEELFSKGLSPIIHSTFEEQHGLVTELITRLQNDYGTQVAALGLGPMLDVLEQHNDAFGDELNITSRESLTFDQVQTARAEAEEGFHKVFFHTVGDYLDDDDNLRDLLATIDDQQDRIARYMRRRGTRPQVDPQTGEVIDGEDNIDASEPQPQSDEPAAADDTSDDATDTTTEPSADAEPAPATE